MSRPPPRAVHRWWLFGGGALLGLVAAFLAPSSSGCVYHDTCIKVTSPGHDWCSNLALAKQWPVGGSFEDAESIVRPDGFPPRGCRCYNDTSGGLLFDIDAFVACDGRRCEIDETFARRLYHDPSPLLARGARLVYHTKAQRHVLTNVEPGSLAHALGLRTGDQLESVDGMVIDDLDSALQAYAQLGDATELEVRVKRGSQWLDFTYSFVQ